MNRRKFFALFAAVSAGVKSLSASCEDSEDKGYTTKGALPQAAFQQLIDQAARNGHTSVTIPSGSFLITDPIYAPYNLTVRGTTGPGHPCLRTQLLFSRTATMQRLYDVVHVQLRSMLLITNAF